MTIWVKIDSRSRKKIISEYKYKRQAPRRYMRASGEIRFRRCSGMIKKISYRPICRTFIVAARDSPVYPRGAVRSLE